MQLVIEDSELVEDDLFCYWLLTQVQSLLAKRVKQDKVELLETKYKDYPVAKILAEGIAVLTVKFQTGRCVISIPSMKSFAKTGYSLAQLCKTINYGCLDIKSYPIFSEVFSTVSANVQSYYTRYQEEVLSYLYPIL